MNRKRAEFMLTVEGLRAELENYGPRAVVYATEGKITLYDDDEGGIEIGSIETPDGMDET